MSLPRRAKERLETIPDHDDLSRGFYDKDKNPNGIINLSLAENSLKSKELADVSFLQLRSTEIYQSKIQSQSTCKHIALSRLRI